jgi:penicillin-binding protein 1A
LDDQRAFSSRIKPLFERLRHFLSPLIARLAQPVVRQLRSAADPALGGAARAGAAGRAAVRLGGYGLGLLALYILLLIPFTPSIADLRKEKADQPAILLSADGKQLATFSRMHREWVELDRISPHVVKALIATEDHRFYEHFGIDWRRTLAGAARTLSGRTEGGSTITQQLARNLYPEEIGRRRTLTRKLKEVITAFKIEHAYTKNEILETYLNTVPFLYNAFGIEMAARTYFDKPAARLNLLESATLIGMLKGTSYYNPVQNPERALQRRNVVLAQMDKHQVLGQGKLEALQKRGLRLDFERQIEALGPAPHFAEQAKRWLIDWADRNDYNLYSDGLIVTSTLDSRLQDQANRAVRRQIDALQAVADVEWGLPGERLLSTSATAYAGMRSRVQPFAHFWKERPSLLDALIRESGAYRNAVEGGGDPDTELERLRKDPAFMARLRAGKTRLSTGFVALDPASGAVMAWVGSPDFRADQYDHVARAQRQPGSTFKPIVYGAALEKGMPPERRFIDSAVEIAVGDGEIWQPTDHSGPSGRSLSMGQALAWSKNTVAAQIMQEVGPKRTIALARRMGIKESRLEPVPALALGASAVTPLEMVSAYATIAGGGQYRKPLLITRIADRQGKVLAEFETESSRALSARNARHLTDMLRGAVDYGTGRGVRTRFGLRADLAGKTGTTQNNADGWFILMHPQLVAGAWVGFNDTRVTMRSDYWGQGGHNALLVVGDFFRQVLDARLVERGARFPSAEDALLSPWLDKVQAWLGKERPPVAQPAARERAREPQARPVPSQETLPAQQERAEPEEKAESPPQTDWRGEDLERAIGQAREALYQPPPITVP